MTTMAAKKLPEMFSSAAERTKNMNADGASAVDEGSNYRMECVSWGVQFLKYPFFFFPDTSILHF